MRVSPLGIAAISLLISVASTDVQNIDLLTYQQTGVNDYLWQDYLPALSEFTYCFWFSGHSRTISRSPQIFSFSRHFDFNHFLLGYDYDSWEIKVYRGSYGYVLQPSTTEENYIWGELHRHCFTWKEDSMKWYADVNYPGRMELYFSFYSSDTYYSIDVDSAFIPLHDQDAYATATWVNGNEMMTGNISDMNMWDYEMSAEMIANLTCVAKGNVINSDTIKLYGTLNSFIQSYQCLGSSSSGSQDLVVDEVIPVPANTRLTSVIPHPRNSSRIIASTINSTIVEIDMEGRCETLVGITNTLDNQCPGKQICQSNTPLVPGLVQLFLSRLNTAGIFEGFYILRDTSVRRVSLEFCRLHILGTPPIPSSSLYVYERCHQLGLMYFVLDQQDGYTWSLDISVPDSNPVIEDKVDPFMSNYRVPVSDTNCSTEWQVPVSSIEDGHNYVAFSSWLIYLNHTTAGLYWYPTSEPISIYRRDTNTVISTGVDAIAPVNTQQFLAISYDMDSVMFLSVKENTRSNLQASFRMLYHSTCAPQPTETFHRVLSIETCMYKCVHWPECTAFALDEDETCRIYDTVSLQPDNNLNKICYLKL